MQWFLIQVVWRAMQEEFIRQYKSLEDMIQRCYPGALITLDFSMSDILEYFSDIARSHQKSFSKGLLKIFLNKDGLLNRKSKTVISMSLFHLLTTNCPFNLKHIFHHTYISHMHHAWTVFFDQIETVSKSVNVIGCNNVNYFF